MNFRMGFWNYVQTGVLDPKEAAEDWEKLGMNTPMSFEFDPEKHDKNEALKLLDVCAEKNMKVIFCDGRTRFERLARIGEKEFAAEVKVAAKDFASHPAFYGFHVGDEPGAEMWRTAEKAFSIVRDATPNAHAFINFLPYWGEPDFNAFVKGGKEAYGQMLSEFLKNTGADILAYDYYGQGAYFERERYVDVYFQNLNLFGKVARENGAEPFPSLLSVGHWSLTVPDEDLIRWQISTAAAHGAAGLMWFFIYERDYDGSFRLAPIDLFWEKTETFGRLSRQNRIFMQYIADKLLPYSFDCVWHVKKQYGGTPEFAPNADLQGVEAAVNPVPLAVTRFKSKIGKSAYAITNLSQTEPTSITVRSGAEFTDMNDRLWLAPGQMKLFLPKN